MKKIMLAVFCLGLLPSLGAQQTEEERGAPVTLIVVFRPNVAIAVQPDGSSARQSPAKSSVAKTGISEVDAINAKYGVLNISCTDGICLFSMPTSADLKQAMADYKALTDLVQFVGQNYPVHLARSSFLGQSSAKPAIEISPAVMDKTYARIAAPAAFFDGGKTLGHASDLAVTRISAAGAVLALNCTEGVDCPGAPAKPKPRAPRCTEGVDCPGDGSSHRGNCTEGVDCPTPPAPRRDCTSGVDCPGDGAGNNHPTPLPPNYQPRPTQPPSRFPPIVDQVPYYDTVTSDWQLYRDVWGNIETGYGEYSRNGDYARVYRGGSETQYQQASSYVVKLTTNLSRKVYRHYWSYVGSDCDPDDSSRCLNWGIQHAWVFDHTQKKDERTMDVTVQFDNSQTLLPWETESFTIHYDGSSVWLDQDDPAFKYMMEGPRVDIWRGRAELRLIPGERIRRAPAQNGTDAWLENTATGVIFVFRDNYASYYQGESLQFQVRITKKEPNGSTRTILEQTERQNGPWSWTIFGGPKVTDSFGIPNSSGSGKYCIANWQFRRQSSKISTPEWMNRHEGMCITK